MSKMTAESKYKAGTVDENQDAQTVPDDLRSAAARQCVRQLKQCEVLSKDWFDLVENVQQLSRLAQLESLIPAEHNVSHVKGRIDGSEGTLWDQENQEDAVRVLVEEAKVNLCLRLIQTYKEWGYDPSPISEKMARVGCCLDEELAVKKCIIFEESLGLLLLRGFMHVETLQLTDVQLLIEHISAVLDRATRVDVVADSLKAQENVVVYYFSALTKHCEQLNNAEVLAKLQSLDVLKKIANHVLRRKDLYTLEFLGVIIEGFSKLADNEDFVWESFFPEREDRVRFLELENVYESVLNGHPDKRAEFRPFGDFLRKMKRTIK